MLTFPSISPCVFSDCFPLFKRLKTLLNIHTRSKTYSSSLVAAFSKTHFSRAEKHAQMRLTSLAFLLLFCSFMLFSNCWKSFCWGSGNVEEGWKKLCTDLLYFFFVGSVVVWQIFTALCFFFYSERKFSTLAYFFFLAGCKNIHGMKAN